MNDTEMVNVLLEKSCTKFKVNALFTAAKRGDVDTVKALLEVSDQNTMRYALVEIATTGNIEMVEMVLENCDRSKYDSMFAHATEQNLDIFVQQLLDEVKPQSITRGLTRAAARGHTKVELLMAKNDAWSINYAVEAAAMEGCVDVINLLRDRCDRDSIQDTVEKARNAGYNNVVKLLTNKKARVE